METMDPKAIDNSLREIQTQIHLNSNEIELIKKMIRIENEKLQSIHNNINEEDIEFHKTLKQIHLIKDETVFLEKQMNAMKANNDCLKISCDQINQTISSLMSEIEFKQLKQKQQIEEFNKIKDEYKTKFESYRDCYELTPFGKVYGNKRIILSEIENQIKLIDSELKQLQADSFKLKCVNSRVEREDEVFYDPIQVIKELANIKLDTESVKMQINCQIERIENQKIENIEQKASEIIEQNVSQVENKAIEEKSIATNEPNVELIDEKSAESISQKSPNPSLGFRLCSPENTSILSNTDFSIRKELTKTSESTVCKSTDFSFDSLFGKSSSKSSPVKEIPQNSSVNSLFGNFGQNYNEGDSPFNFDFGNNSNTSNSPKSPLLWK